MIRYFVVFSTNSHGIMNDIIDFYDFGIRDIEDVREIEQGLLESWFPNMNERITIIHFIKL